MRKLKLDLDELAVESFRTGAAATERGTVQGNGQSSDEPEQHEGEHSDYILTVWWYRNTEQYDTCGGSCYTCEVDCWM